ncbi:MAG TPA: flagellar export chaperone FliS [Gammaproteobacteria bacterium]|nr:flagellar export chaperone FliS [Gammaproteobacteria bacterium]
MTANTAYRQVNKFSALEDASPHKLVDMLYTGALEQIAIAKGQIQRHEVADKGHSLSKAISILEELRRTLDMKQGGELAQNLHDLYEYMKDRLLQANLNNDAVLLEEVERLLGRIQDGWIQIPVELRNKAN